MAYSKELREQTLRYLLNGYTLEEARIKFGASRHTIKKWKKLLYDTGSLERKKTGPKIEFKYTLEKLGELLDKSKAEEAEAERLANEAKSTPFLQKLKKKNGRKKLINYD